jgi:hypothetical protein
MLKIGAFQSFNLWFTCIPYLNLNDLLCAAPYKRQAIKPKKEMQETEPVCKNGLAPPQQVVFPFQPLTLVFKHISYFVDMPKVKIFNCCHFPVPANVCNLKFMFCRKWKNME